MKKSGKQSEGMVAKGIEKQTAKLPSDIFLWGAIGSMALSATFKCLGKNRAALFLGQWVAPFLLFGVYNKIVKVAGSDRYEESEDDDNDTTIHSETTNPIV